MDSVLTFPKREEYPQARFQQWISRVNEFSTEYNRDWAASCVIGKPTNYPRHGDLHGSWASRSYRSECEFIDFSYDEPCLVQELHVYETYNPGAIVRIRCRELLADGSVSPNWTELWTGNQQNDFPRRSRIMKPMLARSVLTSRIRIDQRLTGMRSWSEIDAVQMIGLRPIEDVLAPSKFSIDLKRFYRNREYPDVIFDFPHAKVKIKSHLGVVCSRSEVKMFKKMFTCGMKESIDAKESRIQVIEMLEDVDPRIFELLLEYSYSNHVLVMTEDLIPLYVQADFYAMNDLKFYLEKYMKLILVDENVLSFYNQIMGLDSDVILKKMKNMCLDFLVMNEERVLKPKEVRRCPIFKDIMADLKERKNERKVEEEEEDPEKLAKKKKGIAEKLLNIFG